MEGGSSWAGRVGRAGTMTPWSEDRGEAYERFVAALATIKAPGRRARRVHYSDDPVPPPMVFLIKDIMRREFLTFPAERDVASCIRDMVARREGFALVSEGTAVNAIATEWDFVEKVLAAGLDPSATPIGRIASRPLRSVRVDASTVDVVEEMSSHGIRRMAVTDGAKVVGVVTGKDVFRAFRSYVDKVSSDIARLQSSMP